MGGKYVTMHIKGIGIDMDDGREDWEYLLPSYDPETGKIMDGPAMFEKFKDDIKAGRIEGYSDEKVAEKERQLMYPDIWAFRRKSRFSARIFRSGDD